MLLFSAWFWFTPASVRAQTPSGGLGVPAIVLVDPITVGAVEMLGERTKPLLDTITANQTKQIDAATALNRSIGAWQMAVDGLGSSHLQAGTLAKDNLAPLNAGLIWDNRPTAPAALHTLHGAAVTVAPEDIADQTRLDQLGVTTKDTLATLAQEIETTQQEIATTYAAMLGQSATGALTDLAGAAADATNDGMSKMGLSQQKYEKLRGKLQALNVHLEDLQAQQHTALELLQSQDTVTGSKLDRDGEIAARVQEANHTENLKAFKELNFDVLPWR